MKKNNECSCLKVKHNLSIISTANRPYLNWLADGTKTAEGRVNTQKYREMKVDDSISFLDKKTGCYILGNIKFKHEYSSFEDMLISEGVSNMLPFLKDHELSKGIAIYNAFPGASRVDKFGCVAIGISVTKFYEG